MSETHRITIDPALCGGRPCLRGLRIRVKDVLDLLAAGAGRDESRADFPLLETGDITASLEYAARQSDHPVLRVAWPRRGMRRITSPAWACRPPRLSRGETLVEVI